MADLQTFIDNTKAQPRVVDVVAKAPTAFMLRQIGDSWNFTQTPTHFTFSAVSDQGNTHAVDLIIPYEIWSTLEYAKVDQILMAVNRYDYTENRHTYFLRPDIVDSVALLGSSIVPIAKSALPANLLALVTAIEEVPTIFAAEVYYVIDPQNIDAAVDVVHIENLVEGVSNIRMDELNTAASGDYDRYRSVVPKTIWDVPSEHAAFVKHVQEVISGKVKLDDINLTKGIKLK
jgi:hypothetical protein